MNDERLERLILSAAAATSYPPAPDLRARVAQRLAESRPRPLGLPRFAAGWALAAAFVVVVGAALALNPTRDAIARFFGVEGSKIEVLPTPAPGVTPTPFAVGDVGQPGRTIAPVNLAELPALAGFPAALPSVDDLRLQSTLLFYADQPVVVHHFARFDLWQTRMAQDAAFGKLVQPDSIMEAVSVKGYDAVWLEGTHVVRYLTPGGAVLAGSTRTVEKNTLIWRTDAFFYRIETDLPRAEAIRIAESLP